MPLPPLDRRVALLGLSTALLAACKPGAPTSLGPATLDTNRLAGGFETLRVRALPAAFGFGVALMSGGGQWISDATARFPLQSVFKAFLAAAALALVDAGQLKLAEPMVLTAQDRAFGWDPLVVAWRGPTMTLPVVDLIALAVQKSDNTAADAVMKRIGGPAAVTAWLRGKGIADISVDRYETEIQSAVLGMGPFQPQWSDNRAWTAARNAIPAETREAATNSYLADPRDTATLPATLDFLTRLAADQLLSPASTRLLLRLMTDSRTGEHRLKAGLPADAVLAHKTGTSATDIGLTPATNDIGVVTLAGGRRFAVAAYLAGSTATEAVREGLIADAARLATGCVS